MNNDEYIYEYKSPYRPLWLGFHCALEQDYRMIDDRTFATKKPVPEEKIISLELERR